MKINYWLNLLEAIDQVLGAMVGIPCDISISGWVGYRYHGTWMERAINWWAQRLGDGPNHCYRSIEWDILARYGVKMEDGLYGTKVS